MPAPPPVGRARPALALFSGLPLFALTAHGASQARGDGRIEVLRSVGGLPPEIVGAYREPSGFQQVRSGQYLVFDLPLVVPSIRTAAVDDAGSLWVALVPPFTYVYDAAGEKRRVVQFRGAGIIAPTSLYFAGGNRLLVTPGCYEFFAGSGLR